MNQKLLQCPFLGNKAKISLKGLKIKKISIELSLVKLISIPSGINLKNTLSFLKITLIYF